MKVCIIIPMYNEEAGAQKCLSAISPYLRNLPGTSTVLVVEDGSKDATRDIVEKFISSQEHPYVKIVTHDRNQGYGAALRTGMRYAIDHGYDYALFMDSDLTNHPRYLEHFYEKMQEGYDYIKATRYSKGGKAEGVPWQRRIVSWVGNMIARPAFRLPIRDFTNGFRAVKVEVLAKMTLSERGFPIIVEELWQAKKYARTFCEIPYVLTTRKAEQENTHFSYHWRIYVAYLKYAGKAFVTLRADAKSRPYLLRLRSLAITWICRPWIVVTEKIGFVVNHTVLTVLYVCVFIPTALLRRIFQNDPLHLRWDTNRMSYFTSKHIQPESRFKNLF